jgi:ABC-2 type transport system permease protein
MTWILVRKLLRDVRPALIVVCVVLFLFSAFWVKITQRVTVEIAPVFNVVATKVGDRKLFEDVLFKGPGKVSQAALGWGDLNFERPNDFLAMGMLHPIVLTLCIVWAVGRAAGAVAGELDRGTMELLMSQPVPRNRLLLAHFLVDLIVLPLICLSFFLGTQFGLAVVGDFVPDYTSLKKLNERNQAGPVPFSQKPLMTDGGAIGIPGVSQAFAFLDAAGKVMKFSGATPGAPLFEIPDKPEPLKVSGLGEAPGLTNTFAFMFAISGITMALSAAGRSRWKVVGFAVLILVVMFVANTIGQLWEPSGFVRPLTLFFYYQPQKAMLGNEWAVDLGAAWPGGPSVPGIGVLLAVGAVGYLLALRTFTRRDLPAPL